ncbi:glycerophosphodiester phosphodiesterase [Paenibacillus lactis]|uniref:phosphatidylinositol-specific phospholipase C/glycerophosphodiester phosphodiesterase family protein n=1 Tax=Paenibacillus lactis TaxID=228574 RepID=UPI00203C73D3|nr:phosphatidylinositol-specific phospholipase C/glycerophosphodiester phosphodiesterase family protein [Paenibacillus lactis]MCM3493396.1 glycerophosphodiester phosphodiesterase [Paenibacillus lactis]
MRRVATVGALFSVIVILMLSYIQDGSEERQGFTAYRLIAHAAGSIGDQPYTNAYEAMVANYKQGTRVFEIDFMLTADRKVVARHEWTASMSEQLGQLDQLPKEKQGARLTHEEFMETPILERYRPMDVDAVMDLMASVPDIYIVTDTKEQKDEDIRLLLTELTEAALARDPALLDRVVIQIYNETMLDMVREIYPFSSIIYTLYATTDSPERIIAFVKANHIDAVTMPEHRVNPNFVAKLKEAGAVTYVHTINDANTVNNYEKWGVYGVYSDLLTEPELEKISLRYALQK